MAKGAHFRAFSQPVPNIAFPVAPQRTVAVATYRQCSHRWTGLLDRNADHSFLLPKIPQQHAAFLATRYAGGTVRRQADIGRAWSVSLDQLWWSATGAPDLEKAIRLADQHDFYVRTDGDHRARGYRQLGRRCHERSVRRADRSHDHAIGSGGAGEATIAAGKGDSP